MDKNRDSIIVEINKRQDTDILGNPMYSITRIRKCVWIEHILFCLSKIIDTIKNKLVKSKTDVIEPVVFSIANDGVLPCSLEVYPSRSILKTIWASEARQITGDKW